MAVRPARDPGLSRRRLLLGAGLSIALHVAALGWLLRAPAAPAPPREAAGVELLSIELAAGPRSDAPDRAASVPAQLPSPLADGPSRVAPVPPRAPSSSPERVAPIRGSALPAPPARSEPIAGPSSNRDAAPSGASAELAPTARAESVTGAVSVQTASPAPATPPVAANSSRAPGLAVPRSELGRPGSRSFWRYAFVRRCWTFLSQGFGCSAIGCRF